MSNFLKKLKPVELAFKKAVLAILALFMTRSKEEGLPGANLNVKNILLVRYEKIGDVIVTLPLVDAIKKMWPDCKITFIASHLSNGVIMDDPRFEKVYVYNKGLKKVLKLVRSLRKQKFDYSIDLITRDTATGMLLANLCAPKAIVIGMGKQKYKKFYDIWLPHPQDKPNMHIIDYNLTFLRALNINQDIADRHAHPFINNQAGKQAIEICNELDDKKWFKMGLNLSAGKSTCAWELDKFKLLTEKLLNYHESLQIIVITAPNEYEKGIELKARFDNRVFLPPPGLNLMTVSAIIKNMHLLTTPDTSLVHIARAFKVPVVGLYRQFLGEYKFWRPYGQKNGLVLSGNEEDVFDITVDRVMDEITKVLNEYAIIKSNGLVSND